MGTDKPLIAILMAVYRPRADWLCEQLKSLNAQTYPNIRLYIRDDCSPEAEYEAVLSCARENITAFEYEIARNEKNLGSNGTFELLTRGAQGEYFAYCDQDDVWLPEKLTVLQESIVREGAELVCSDMYVIGADGHRTAQSITEVRRHHVFRSGEGLAPKLLVSNFVTGCTALVRAESAKNAVPFCPHMVHDHYLALYCAERGKIVSLPDRLINYRIHTDNQTLVMAGVSDRESYCRVRIVPLLRRMEWLNGNFSCGDRTRAELEKALAWARARETNWRHAGGKRTVWKYRRFSMLPSVYEVFGSRLPQWLFGRLLTAAKQNRI